MDSLPFSTKTLIFYSTISQELVCSIMANFITHRLRVSKEMDLDIHSATCKTGDQLMAVITLSSTEISADNM
jgi:hypothetical protein